MIQPREFKSFIVFTQGEHIHYPPYSYIVSREFGECFVVRYYKIDGLFWKPSEKGNVYTSVAELLDAFGNYTITEQYDTIEEILKNRFEEFL